MSCRTDHTIPTHVNWNSFHKYRLRESGYSAGSYRGSQEVSALQTAHCFVQMQQRRQKRKMKVWNVYMKAADYLRELKMFRAEFFERHSTNRPTLRTVRFEVIAAVIMKIGVFWDVTPCRLVTLPTFRRDVVKPLGRRYFDCSIRKIK